jgi:hypothetical protein
MSSELWLIMDGWREDIVRCIEWYIGIRDGRWLVDGWNDGELQFIEI